ncbi:MAG: hypothetical protein HYZ14_02010 [Bacteroidetes bacterium]|nr:hypothetical protein [Bacteroidota bacterium]
MRYFVFLIFLCCSGWVAAQHWAWVNHLTGGGGSHYAIDCVAGNDSNSFYFCGRYRATATFYGQDGSNIVNPPFGGSRDIFLVKTDSAGHFVWGKTIGGTDTEYGFAVTVDEFDNVYLSGQFYTGCTFEGVPISSIGSADVYVAKFDTDGNFQWVKTFGGTAQDTGTKLTCDKSGAIYLAGTQGGNFYYNTDSLVDPGYFVAKLDYNGNIIWAKGPDNITAALSNLYGIKYYKEGIYVAGKYNGTMKMDAITLVSNGSWSDLFFAKLDTAGTAQWAYDAGSTTYDLCNDIAVNDSFVYITGAYSGTISFDTIVRVSDQAVVGSTGALNSRDAYIAKYDSTGACYWVVEHKSLTADEGTSLFLDAKGNLIVSGSYLQSPDPTVAGSTGELRIESYNPQSGALNWGITSTGTQTGLAHAVCGDPFGNIYFSGAVKDVHAFEGYTIPASSSVYSGVMCKILPPLNTNPSNSPISCMPDTVQFVAAASGYPLYYDWYYGAYSLLQNSGDTLIVILDPSLGDSVSCIVSNGIETDTLNYDITNFSYPQPTLVDSIKTCNSSVLLNAGSSGEYYDWGSGNVLYDSTHMALATGLYTVLVTNSGGCSVSDSVYVQLADCTGLNETNVLIGYYTADGILNVRTSLSGYNLMVYATDGKLLLNRTNLSGNSETSLYSLAPGLYIVLFTNTASAKISSGTFVR